MNKTVATTALAAVLALAALAAVVGSARATYPGATNGRIAFGINVNGNTDVYTARPDGQDLRRLTTDPGFDACAAYSADGRRIAYCSGQGGGPVQVWTMKQNGTDKQQVTHMSGTGDLPRLLTRREQDRLRCPAGRRRPRPRHLRRQQRRQRPHQADERRRQQRLPRLLTRRQQDRLHQQSHRHLAGLRDERRRLRPDATHLRPAAQGPGARLEPGRLQDRLPRRHARHRRHRQPSWGDIWVMNADGSGQHPITSGATYYGTAWSPDGSRIATLDMPSRTIYTVNAADGSDPQAVHARRPPVRPRLAAARPTVLGFDAPAVATRCPTLSALTVETALAVSGFAQPRKGHGGGGTATSCGQRGPISRCCNVCRNTPVQRRRVGSRGLRRRS